MTRIASVKPHPISVPLKDVRWTAHEELKASSVIVVEVRTEDGLTGYGQIHGSPMKAICAWVERFGEIIRGMDALAHVAVWDRLFSLTCPRPGGIGGADGLPPPLPRGERPQIMAAPSGASTSRSGTSRASTRACRCGGCWEARSVRFRPTRQGATTVPERRTRCTPKSSPVS